MRRGETIWVKNSDEDRILTFMRKSGNEEILVAINMTSSPFFGSVEANGNFEEITPNMAKAISWIADAEFGFIWISYFRKK